MWEGWAWTVGEERELVFDVLFIKQSYVKYQELEKNCIRKVKFSKSSFEIGHFWFGLLLGSRFPFLVERTQPMVKVGAFALLITL